MSRIYILFLTIIFVFIQSSLSVSFASAEGIIAGLHKAPPAPCISKATDDMSSGMRIYPDGITREEVRNVMAWVASNQPPDSFAPAERAFRSANMSFML